MPGLVEVHTDNLEKHLMPRNGVLWPTLPAVVAHDAQCVAAGITTVLDACRWAIWKATACGWTPCKAPSRR
ncbi:hypothetical protein JOS77_22210 [Chromobacterium haemolyticum]|nr:hypothetical protein JOS77_22210 [Chromobacterium haemolyticum]